MIIEIMEPKLEKGKASIWNVDVLIFPDNTSKPYLYSMSYEGIEGPLGPHTKGIMSRKSIESILEQIENLTAITN